MKYCGKCGTQNENEMRYCVNCGEMLEAQATTPIVGNMKYCSSCGSSVHSNAVICTKCGCSLSTEKKNNNGKDGNATAVKIFLILSCVVQCFFTFCISLAWCLPITIVIFGKLNRGERIGTGLKVCTLLFVNIISGILLLCRSED